MTIGNEREKLKVSTRAMYDEFLRQGVPIEIIDSSVSLLEYQDVRGKKHLLFSTISNKSSAAGSAIARNKVRTAAVANRLGIKTPQSRVCASYAETAEFLKTHDRIVIKPTMGSGGSGITTDIIDQKQLRAAYDYAREYGEDVIAQVHFDGDDLRLLVVAGEFCSAVQRIPAQVTGDGESTVRQLIVEQNTSGDRAAGSMSTMDLIGMDSAKQYLGSGLDVLPAKGEVIRVAGPANQSLGGTVQEATHLVSEAMKRDAEEITNKLELGICGVDIMVNTDTGEHILIEVNSVPGINMHNNSFWGTSSSAIEKYIKWLVA